MRVIDFVTTIGNLSESFVDIYVNDKLICGCEKRFDF